MDCLQGENKDSEDSIQLELSPMNSKGISNVEEPVNVTAEKEDTERPKESEEENVDKVTIIELINSSTEEKEPDSKNETLKDISLTKNDEVKKKKESTLLETSNSSKLNSSNSKISNVGKNSTSTVTETKEVKRKRTITGDQRSEASVDETEAKVKRAKTKSTNDNFCWRCHKESVDAKCSACPRSWHRRCMGGAPPTSINETWICGECATILRAENAETRSEIMAHLSIDHLCMLLKYIVERMRSCQGSEPFLKAVDLIEVPNYLDYVVRPMDLTLLESNVRSKLYGSTDAFMADAKWIQHNCIVFNTCGGVYADTSKLTNAAKHIIKTAKQEVAEIEACPDCYVRGRNLPRPHPSWFVEPCRKPHPLIWAKLKGFPFWPAKAMPRVNGQGHVDVRFFGQHDRAWVAPKDLYLYSREPPSPLPRKRKVEMAECIKEITRHCKKLESVFGPFQFAPSKTPYFHQDPLQIKIMLPQYDPLRPDEPGASPALVARRKSPPIRKRVTSVKRKLETDTTNETVESSDPIPSKSPTTDIAKPSESDSSLTESVKQRKRLKKVSSNNSNEDNDKEKLKSIVQTQETITKSNESPTTRVNRTIINGSVDDKVNTTDGKSAGGPVIIINQKIKNDKPIIPLEKSLAGLLRTVKGRFATSRNSNTKVVTSLTQNNTKTETKVNSIKVYKPKARMVDKVNAEKALKSTIEKDQKEEIDTIKKVEGKIVNGVLTPVSTVSLANSPTTTTGAISLLQKKKDNNIVISNSLLKIAPKKLGSRILVVNNGTIETKQQQQQVQQQLNVNCEEANNKIDNLTVRVKQEPNLMNQTSSNVQQKQSRAKKSFPNKAPRLPHILPKLPKLPQSTAKSLDTMVYIPAHNNENGMDLQLPPPEAGPISSQLHRGANELAKRMSQFLAETVRQAAESNPNELGNSLNSHQATIHSLRLQIERMRWQHQQQLTELKHNTDRTLREMRASLEAERLRSIEEVRKEAEEERLRCIDETKTRQWCAYCGREALFYCCWNTAYCDHNCQQSHWQAHQRKCAQKPSQNSAGDSSNRQHQQQKRHQQQQQQQQQQHQQNDSERIKGKLPIGTIATSILRSSTCQSPTVTTKNLKIP